MALEHITADLVKIDINGSIYEIPRADVKAFIAEKTSVKSTDDKSKKPKEAKKAKKIDEPEVAEVIEEIKSVEEIEEPKDTKLQK